MARGALKRGPNSQFSSDPVWSIVNQNGRVYQKDLGEKTEVGAAAIQDYNPDDSSTEAKD